MKGMGGMAALVAVLSAACLFLMWKYTGWHRRVRAAATALLCIAVALAFVPAILGNTREEPVILHASGLETVPVQGLPSAPVVPSEAAPETPEATPPETPETPEETSPASEEPPALPEEPPPPEPEPSPSASAAKPGGPSYYILNKSTKKFHLPTCSDAARIKAENYATMESRQGAIDGGYVPCKNCKP